MLEPNTVQQKNGRSRKKPIFTTQSLEKIPRYGTEHSEEDMCWDKNFNRINVNIYPFVKKLNLADVLTKHQIAKISRYAVKDISSDAMRLIQFIKNHYTDDEICRILVSYVMESTFRDLSVHKTGDIFINCPMNNSHLAIVEVMEDGAPHSDTGTLKIKKTNSKMNTTASTEKEKFISIKKNSITSPSRKSSKEDESPTMNSVLRAIANKFRTKSTDTIDLSDEKETSSIVKSTEEKSSVIDNKLKTSEILNQILCKSSQSPNSSNPDGLPKNNPKNNNRLPIQNTDDHRAEERPANAIHPKLQCPMDNPYYCPHPMYPQMINQASMAPRYFYPSFFPANMWQMYSNLRPNFNPYPPQCMVQNSFCNKRQRENDKADPYKEEENIKKEDNHSDAKNNSKETIHNRNNTIRQESPHANDDNDKETFFTFSRDEDKDIFKQLIDGNTSCSSKINIFSENPEDQSFHLDNYAFSCNETEKNITEKTCMVQDNRNNQEDIRGGEDSPNFGGGDSANFCNSGVLPERGTDSPAIHNSDMPSEALAPSEKMNTIIYLIKQFHQEKKLSDLKELKYLIPREEFKLFKKCLLQKEKVNHTDEKISMNLCEDSDAILELTYIPQKGNFIMRKLTKRKKKSKERKSYIYK